MNYNKGFTLVELMVTLSMTGIIVAAVYSTYTLQQKTYIAQDQVVEMQQNNRVAIFHMVRELRMAGYSPQDNDDVTITAATLSGISFKQDLNEDGDAADADESITYGFTATEDNDNNGVVNSSMGVTSLRRNSGGGLQEIAENIQAIEFLYNLDNGIRTTSPSNAQLDDIRSITISILARADKRDAKFINNTVYTQASAIAPLAGIPWDLGAGPGIATSDNFRRRLLITTVQCRNMGI